MTHLASLEKELEFFMKTIGHKMAKVTEERRSNLKRGEIEAWNSLPPWSSGRG